MIPYPSLRRARGVKTIRTIVVAAVVIVVVLALLTSVFIWSLRPLEPFSAPVSQPFRSWGDSWILPPLPTAEYSVNLEYAKKEGGRIGERLEITVIDETCGERVSVDTYEKYGTGQQVRENGIFVGNCHLVEGHRYRVEVDPDQVRELSRHHHRLTIGLSVDELRRRSRLP